MKRTVAILTLGIAQVCLFSCSPASRSPSVNTKSSESVERALMKMERDWADANVRHDVATIALTNPASPLGLPGNPMGVDNISLTR